MRTLIARFTLLLASSLMPFATSAADADLKIHDPYVRLAPPGAPTTGAFMVIKNMGSTDRKLLKAESPVAKTVELHTHINENGVMKMREVPDIEIKAQSQTELKPGGLHVMLIGMKQTLKEGDLVPISLNFDDGSKQQIEAPVRKLPTTMTVDMDMKH